MSEGVTLLGEPGGSETHVAVIIKHFNYIIHYLPKGTSPKKVSTNRHTKGILCDDRGMFCRLSNAVLVLSADPEDVLLHSCELAGLKSGVFHCG